MRRISTLLASAAALLFAAAMPSSPAHAGFMFDLTVSGNWTGSGDIDFTTLSGTSTAGVDAFSFHVASGDGSPQNYDLTDINTIDWSINSSNVLTLDLRSIAIPFDSGISGIVLTNEPGIHPVPCSSLGLVGSVTCQTGSSTPSGTLTATFVPQVPEPGALALLAPALLGIAVYLRRRKVA